MVHANGVDLLVRDTPRNREKVQSLQELLGHKDIALTLGTYSHVTPTMGEQAAQAMEELLRAKPVQNGNENGNMVSADYNQQGMVGG